MVNTLNTQSRIGRIGRIRRIRARAGGGGGLAFFQAACRAAGLPEPVAEYCFHPLRRWRLDWAWPDRRLALEIEGGVWTRGRHTRGAGFLADMEKYNHLALAGWRLLRCTPEEFRSLWVIGLLGEALRGRTHA